MLHDMIMFPAFTWKFTKESKAHIGNYSFYCDHRHKVAQINVLIGDGVGGKRR